MFVNSQEFRREALYFAKHGKYDCGIKGSKYYDDYWSEQRKRCLSGYSAGGVWITGYHYYYLNFCQIQKVVKKNKNDSYGNRIAFFPDFWDLDYVYFMSLHIAKYGIASLTPNKTYEEGLQWLKSLPYDLNLKIDRDNLMGGRHLMFLKPRGIGASFKGGAVASRNFHLVPDSKTYMLADDKEYLIKDGLYSKFLDNRTFVNTYTEFSKHSEFKNSITGMHFRASYKNERGDEDGYKSEVIGVSLKNNPDKARGKRGIIILWEEAGKFPNMHVAWQIARESVEEDGAAFGTMVAFGTGGTEGADFEALEKMFFSPEAYNLLAFKNIFDEGMDDTDIGLFTPATMSIGIKDENGNSLKALAKEQYDKKRAKAAKAADGNLLLQTKAEKPYTPDEAVLNTTKNIFLTNELLQWGRKVKHDINLVELGVAKELYYDSNKGVHAKLSEHIPIRTYPHDPNKIDLINAPVIEWEKPFIAHDGKIPNGLYFICHDPFAENDAEDMTSLGVAYVMMNLNGIVPGGGNKIVASYIARPKTTDDYNRVLFMLAERWNAMIAFESDRGDVLGYAKRFNKTHWLVPEMELAWDERMRVSKASTVRYGIRMGSGKDNIKVLTGNRYLKDWLIDERGQTLNGNTILNVHTIYDSGLLEELRLYRAKKNVDRISALRVGMYYLRECAYKGIEISKPQIRKSSSKKAFLERQIY